MYPFAGSSLCKDWALRTMWMTDHSQSSPLPPRWNARRQHLSSQFSTWWQQLFLHSSINCSWYILRWQIKMMRPSKTSLSVLWFWRLAVQMIGRRINSRSIPRSSDALFHFSCISVTTISLFHFSSQCFCSYWQNQSLLRRTIDRKDLSVLCCPMPATKHVCNACKGWSEKYTLEYLRNTGREISEKYAMNYVSEKYTLKCF